MKKLLLFLLFSSFCLQSHAAPRLQGDTAFSGNVTLTANSTFTAASGATVNFGNATVTLPATVTGGGSSFQPLEDQRLSTTNSPTFNGANLGWIADPSDTTALAYFDSVWVLSATTVIDGAGGGQPLSGLFDGSTGNVASASTAHNSQSLSGDFGDTVNNTSAGVWDFGAASISAGYLTGDGGSISLNGSPLSELFPYAGTLSIPGYSADEYVIPGSFQKFGDDTTCTLLAIIPPGGVFSIKDGAGSGYEMMSLSGGELPGHPNVILFRGIVAAGSSIYTNTPALDFNNRLLMGAWTSDTPFKLKSYTVSTLPSASSAGAGATAFVTDASSPTWHGTLTGGSSTKTPVYSDGSVWRAY